MSALDAWTRFGNARAVELARVPVLDVGELRRDVARAVARDMRVAALFAAELEPGGAPELVAVLADDSASRLLVARAALAGERFPALTPECPQVHLFEREIAEQYGLAPEGHPWLKPVRFERPLRSARPVGASALPAIGVSEFYAVEGEQVHEVAVGPVHAGVIEPGHFRFQCHGEEVFHLEISLGYQHRGVERALVGGPDKRSLHYAETTAGDTTIGHATAHGLVLEALAGCQKPARAQTLRGVALELERLANHVGDLGALAGDVGFLPTASYCGRLRGDFLNMTALLCGNRFGRGMVRPGGVRFDLGSAAASELLARLAAAEVDTRSAVELLWNASSVMARFEDTGPVPLQVARDLGLVGPCARAAGLARDVRHDQPWGIFRFSQIPVSTFESGDVFARAWVRWLEIRHSIAFLRQELQAIPQGPIRVPLAPSAPRALAAALVEGWRGEICHVAITDERGKLARYKVVDPSFHNWAGLAYALRNQQISDFPLCNKSFNLSYCGHDL